MQGVPHQHGSAEGAVGVIEVGGGRHAPARDQHATLVVHQELSDETAVLRDQGLSCVEALLQGQEVSVLTAGFIRIPLFRGKYKGKQTRNNFR